MITTILNFSTEAVTVRVETDGEEFAYIYDNPNSDLVIVRDIAQDEAESMFFEKVAELAAARRDAAVTRSILACVGL